MTEQKFTDAFISELNAALDHAGLSSLFETYIAENSTHTTFCKTYDLHVRTGMNRLKDFITHFIESDESKEKVYDSMAGFITTTFSGAGTYFTPLELFTSDRMKQPANPQPPVIKKADLPVQAIQFSLELNDFPQKLTRRFIIRDDVKMTTLAYAILSMIKAAGGHLFDFEVTQTEFHSEYMQRVSKSPFFKNTDPFELPHDMLEASSPATIIELPDPYGDTFDFNDFSLEEANECLKGDMKMYKESYENGEL